MANVSVSKMFIVAANHPDSFQVPNTSKQVSIQKNSDDEKTSASALTSPWPLDLDRQTSGMRRAGCN